MATLTAVGAGGNFTASGTWSPAQTPTAADDCLLTVASGPVTIDTGAVCRSLNLTGYTSTLTHTAAVTLTIGDATAGLSNIALEFPTSGWTYTLGSATTSAITFVSTSATQQTINFGGQSTGNVIFNAASNGSWLYTGAQTQSTSAQVNIAKGAVDFNGQTLTFGNFINNGTNTRSVTLGSANITLLGGATAWNTVTTGLTFSGASATITLSGVNATFTGAGLTYGTVSFGTAATPAIIAGANTFAALTKTTAAVKTQVLTLSANQVVTGTFTPAGNSTINRLLVTSDILGTPRTITAAVVTASNVDLRDITGAGAASWDLSAITGGSGNCGGNSLKALGDAAFTTPATQTATGTASFSWSTHGWTSRVPLPQDDVIINNAFIAGRTVTLDMPRAGKSITWTGATGTPAWAVTTATTIYGSVTKIAGMTQSGTTNVTFEGRGAFTLTNAGVVWTNPLVISMFGGSLTLQDAMTSTSTFIHTNGNFVDAGFAITVTNIGSTSGFTRTLTRSGALTLTGTGAVLNYTAAGLTYINNNSSITVSDATQGTSKTFAGGGLSLYGALILSGKNIILTGANTFASLALNNLGDTTGVALPAGVTTTVTGAVTSTASSGNVAKLISSTAGTPARLSSGSTTISLDYLSLKDSAAMGVASWYAGANSTNVSGNTGWMFAAPNTVWGAVPGFPRRIAYGSPVNRQSPLTRGLVGWWMVLPKRYGGACLINLLGRNHGALVGMGASSATSGWGATTRRGGHGELRYDGADDYVDLGSPPVLQLTGPLTVVAAVRLSSLVVANRPAIISHGYDGTNTGFTLGFNQIGAGVSEGLGRLVFFSYNAPVTAGSYTTQDFSSPLETAWVRLGGSWDGTLWNTWVNGTLDRNSEGTQTTAPDSATTSLTIGGLRLNPTPSRFLDGAVDDVLIYNRALSASEMRALDLEMQTFHPRMLRRGGGVVAGGEATVSGFHAGWARGANQMPFAGGGVLL